MPETKDTKDLLSLTARIASAHVRRSPLGPSEFPKLLEDVYRALAGLGKGPPISVRPEPRVPVKKSITPDYILCLEDGLKFKMLKGHLKAAYNLSPAQYRERWGLSPDYPMVAPNYAKQRSRLAKAIGLGRTRGNGRKQVRTGFSGAAGVARQGST